MSVAIFLCGNFGVGKSSIIDLPVLEKKEYLLHIGSNIWILGKKINGADSISNIDKESVFNYINENADKNIIIAGVYYTKYVDFLRIKKSHVPIIVYLKTSFENNAKRISKRGGIINPKTYIENLKNHLNLMKNLKGIAQRIVIDNNKSLEDVKSEFWNIAYNLCSKQS
jgi:gluconate kinase